MVWLVPSLEMVGSGGQAKLFLSLWAELKRPRDLAKEPPAHHTKKDTRTDSQEGTFSRVPSLSALKPYSQPAIRPKKLPTGRLGQRALLPAIFIGSRCRPSPLERLGRSGRTCQAVFPARRSSGEMISVHLVVCGGRRRARPRERTKERTNERTEVAEEWKNGARCQI